MLPPSSVTVAKAKQIMSLYEGWKRDQEKPFEEREGWKHPGPRALEMARFVLSEVEE